MSGHCRKPIRYAGSQQRMPYTTIPLDELQALLEWAANGRYALGWPAECEALGERAMAIGVYLAQQDARR